MKKALHMKTQNWALFSHQVWKATEESQVVDGMMKSRKHVAVSLSPTQNLPSLGWKDWEPMLIQFLSFFLIVNLRTFGIKQSILLGQASAPWWGFELFSPSTHRMLPPVSFFLVLPYSLIVHTHAFNKHLLNNVL